MEQPWRLPSTWKWTDINSIGEVVAGGTPSTKEPSYWGGEINWISPADLTGYTKKTIARGAKSITQQGLNNSSAKLMPKGSVHFSSRAPIGYVAISSEPLCTNQGFKSVVPAEGVLNEYLYYYLKASKQIAEQRATGTTFKEISGAAFGKLPAALAPYNEQKRIVAKIDELFSELDKGIENLNTARDQLKIYRQAVLDQACTGELLVAIGLENQPFGESLKTNLDTVIRELGQGWSPKCLNHPSEDESKWGVIKTTAIQHLSFDESENKELPENLEPRPHLEILSGDVLVTRAGPRKRVGVTCLVRKCRQKLMICDKAYRLRPNEAKILPEFLEMALNAPKTLWDIEELKTGINDSGVNLTQKGFLNLKIFVPSLENQKLTLAELERSLSKIDHVEAQIEGSLSSSESLRQSILKRAFSGKLVEQDPNDEPASTLLERIGAEKSEGTKKSKAAK